MSEPPVVALPKLEHAGHELHETGKEHGASKNKPFCDGSHAAIKFQDGIEPADKPQAQRRT